ncbi:MAG TPA: 16S rRNA (adenine(1518)-N(6)/adenine(1519)-N(6))-dimethyltransferase RsmA [Bacteroidia bacterium]|jgi:16S rRNA (adenine1518-N6/adenine1519-N6)-dimethyltransferase|nr:16S rRNA (adenine(1518)-N(6)/adenine(1519)-N(6))-dimethyltransferase RsmA [Bacteroidia bacterium]
MNQYVKPKKRLGQHFLKDENIAKKVASYLTPSDDILIEIGPGTGNLTTHLVKEWSDRLWLVEVDDESVEYLQNVFPELKPRTLHTDFLQLELDKTFPNKSLSVIGNFPYNISSQILFRVLKYRAQVTQMVGMFQKEVAKRICSPPGNKDYGILSVLVQAYFNTEYLLDVPPQVFIPPPAVDSGVIKIERKPEFTLGCNEELFTAVVKAGFNQRRKKLSNALSGVMGDKKIKSELLDKRAEQLSWQDFEVLTKMIEESRP